MKEVTKVKLIIDNKTPLKHTGTYKKVQCCPCLTSENKIEMSIGRNVPTMWTELNHRETKGHIDISVT